MIVTLTNEPYVMLYLENIEPFFKKIIFYKLSVILRNTKKTNNYIYFKMDRYTVLEWNPSFLCLFSIPEVWVYRYFWECWEYVHPAWDCRHSGSTASVLCHFPLGVTFPIGAIINFFLFAVAWASLWVSKGAVHSSS